MMHIPGYEIIEEIGSGGMGTVYRGIDSRTRLPVAIKRLKSELLAGNPDMVERFIREGEALRVLNHPNIVKMLDMFQSDGDYFIVMEYVSGGSLWEHLSLPINRILEIALDLADALSRAHHLKIIHRDLKPANVLIAPDGTPRLTDFGIAHIGSGQRITKTGIAIGTPDYLSPEALNGEEVDARTDIWAFGVMLFEMLAGQRPFTADNLIGTFSAILTKPTPDLEALRPDAPLALIDLIYRMLEKDRHTRISSVRLIGAELEAIIQGRANSLRFNPPTPDTQDDQVIHNLPPQTTPFIGREDELNELANLLANPNIRLITILAPGGMGKTRLALETASSTQFGDGVYFIPLDALTSPDFIVSAVAEGLDFQFYGSDEPKQQLLDFLRGKSMLLVLDNFEHILEGADIVGHILAYAAGVKIIVTSRQRLNLSGETLFILGGMDFPDWETDALNYAAVKLFLQSARRIRPHFELDGNDLSALARICRLVDGMPLAIILAASWLETLSLHEIAKEIEISLDFLETELRDIPERQRSIRGIFESAWTRLSDDERAVFRKLSIFLGGFTREAVVSVAGASLKTLAALVNKSLLRRDPDSGRYHVHELLRQYAEEKLKTAGETEMTYAAYSHYYMDCLKRWDAEVRSPRQTAALHEMQTDFENLRRAWLWALSHQQYDAISQTLDCLLIYADRNHGLVEIRQLLQQVGIDHPLREQIEVRRQRLNYLASDRIDHRLVETLLERARERGDQLQISYCLWVLGNHALHNGDYETLYRTSEEALALRRKLGDEFFIAQALNMMSVAYERNNQFEKHLDAIHECVNIRRRLGDKDGLSFSLDVLGTTYTDQGDFAEAEKYFDEAIAIHNEIGKTSSFVLVMADKAKLVFWRGDFEAAAKMAQTSINFAQNQNYLGAKSTALAVLSCVMSASGDYVRGRDLCEQARTAVLYDWVIVFVDWALALASCGLGDDQTARRALLAALRNAGEVLQSTTMQLLCLPVAAVLAADRVQAVELLGSISNAPQDLMAWLDQWALFNQRKAQLQAELPVDVYAAAWKRGQARDLDTLVHELLQN